MRSYCKVCCRNLPRAQFSGTGLTSQVCRKCQRLSPAEQQRRQALDELAGFARQKNLSAQNRRRLEVLVKSANETVSGQARVLLEVALVHPHLSKRISYLREKHPALHDAYVEAFGGATGDGPAREVGSAAHLSAPSACTETGEEAHLRPSPEPAETSVE